MSVHKSKPENYTITRRAGLVACGTLTSRLLGAVRDAVIAASFTVGLTDAFFVAFTIPNALRALLAEGAINNAVIPVLSEVKEKRGESRAREFFASLTGMMLLILTVVSLLGVIFAPQLVTLYAAGFKAEPHKFETTVTLARIVFPYLFFIGIAALSTGALQTLKNFFIPAFAPAFFNISMIVAPIIFVPLVVAFGMPAIISLPIGALVGGLLQSLFQFPSLIKVRMFNRPRLNLDDRYVRKVLRLMVPLILGIGVYQINILLTRLLASYLPSGSQSYLFYGQRLVEIPQGMFALAIASATLPSIASLRNRGFHEQAKQTFIYSLRLSLFVSIPASTFLAIMALPTVTVFFGRGAFRTEMVMETSRSLIWMAAGVWAIASNRNIVQMFFAYNDTRSPVLCSALNLLVFVTVSVLLIGSSGHVGIAAATSCAAMVQLMSLLILLHRRIDGFDLKSILLSVGRCSIASCTMAVLLFFISSYGKWEQGGNDPINILVFVGSLVTAGIGYLSAAYLLKVPELREIVRSVLPSREH